MSKIDENLSEIFECESIETENLPTIIENKEIISIETDVKDDFVVARDNITGLIEKGNTAIDNLLKVAKESEHPRVYEVAANFLKTMAELNKDLLEIQKRKKELTGVSDESNKNKGALIDKAVFVGSTEELISLIKGKK